MSEVYDKIELGPWHLSPCHRDLHDSKGQASTTKFTRQKKYIDEKIFCHEMDSTTKVFVKSSVTKWTQQKKKSVKSPVAKWTRRKRIFVESTS